MIKQKYKTCHIASLVLKKMASFFEFYVFFQKVLYEDKNIMWKPCENHFHCNQLNVKYSQHDKKR